MAKYLLAYKGGSVPESESEQQAVLAAWGGWFEQLGLAVVDGGNPFAASASVSSDGRVGDDGSGLSGYSLIEAGSIDEAVEMAKGCPVLTGGGGVEVYETFDPMA